MLGYSSLKIVLTRSKPPPDPLLPLQMFRAVEHLHSCGMMHRDLKPGNILIDPLWRLKLCDLGLVRSTASFDPLSSHLEHDPRFTGARPSSHSFIDVLHPSRLRISNPPPRISGTI